jgi:hypothetical protein
MNKPRLPKPAAVEPGKTDPTDEPASAAAPRSAMKLPPGVVPKSSGAGPMGKGPAWERGQHGRPQRDAARRAGKSRKVH